jgi:hypothetical protein
MSDAILNCLNNYGKIMIAKIKSAVVCLSVAFLSACGGGGGTSSPSSNPSAALLAITPSNYAGVATESVAGANGTSDASSLGTNLVGAQISQSGSFGLKRVALSTATTVLNNWAVFNNPTIVGAVTERTVNCSGGGTVSASVNDADNSSTATAGDSISATFTSCNESGLLVNGSLSIVINSYSGNLSTSGSASLTMVFNNITAGSDAINGSLNLAVSQSSAASGSVTLTMPSLAITSSGNSLTYTDFNLTASDSGSSVSLTMAGNVSSSKYGGSVDISTPTAMTIDSFNSVTGTILMTGKNATKVRIAGQGTTSILIEADTTGNGTYDTNTTVTLASLGL